MSTTSAVRSPAQRRREVLAHLREDRDVWLATADGDGRPHLVPLALCWDGERIIVRLRRSSRSARNAIASGRVRLALGVTRDVVVVDATVDAAAVPEAPEVAALYAERTGWDGSGDDALCCFLFLSPVRVQAWREIDEFGERTLMRQGRWVV